MKKIFLPVIVAATISLTGCSVINTIAKGLTIFEAVQGLRDALNQGLFRSFDGFTNPNSTDNAVLKFAFNGDAAKVQKSLEDLGLGPVLEQATRKINTVMRSSVQAAKPIFINSIKNMSFSDAMGILVTNNQQAATDYFKSTNRSLLMQAFRPVVDSTIKVEKVDADWKRITTVYNAIPFKKQALETNLGDFLAARMIDGMCEIMANEERNIRGKIEFRKTLAMQRAFGYADEQLRQQATGTGAKQGF